jgi:hypothetical protein
MNFNVSDLGTWKRLFEHIFGSDGRFFERFFRPAALTIHSTGECAVPVIKLWQRRASSRSPAVKI